MEKKQLAMRNNKTYRIFYKNLKWYFYNTISWYNCIKAKNNTENPVIKLSIKKVILLEKLIINVYFSIRKNSEDICQKRLNIAIYNSKF